MTIPLLIGSRWCGELGGGLLGDERGERVDNDDQKQLLGVAPAPHDPLSLKLRRPNSNSEKKSTISDVFTRGGRARLDRALYPIRAPSPTLIAVGAT